MDELPKIISVDDHVVEPSHVWQTWLPDKHRAKGPRVERKRWGDFKHLAGAKYEMKEDPEGLWGDAWYYEDRLIYVHKKF
ncbi:MAG: amidohydrolase, partial [Actinobacteria bacterium]